MTKTVTHHFLHVDSFPVIVIQHAAGHVPPQWPNGVLQQMHVDLTTDDTAAADERVLGAGGRRLGLRTTPALLPATHGSRVYASPAGHPFCIRST